ncbi:plasmid mobilization protein [Geodermatophilus sp. SYSU D00079]
MTTELGFRRRPAHAVAIRSRTFLFRCTPSEAALIERAASDLGGSLSDLIRDAALSRAREQVPTA